MAKGKKPTSALSKGAKGRKNHGPSRHLHHSITPKALRMSMAKDGVLGKYSDFESWQLACAARGSKKINQEEFAYFITLSMEKKKEYFANLKGSRRG